jgi:peptidoglycan/LPS O-acetylase OafA/YrhL
MDLERYRNATYRHDIQGVRAIGAILIMFYHIWFNKVSGGVDVFFVVSGYFMAGMLARAYLRTGKVKPFEFWGRVIRRVVPLAYIVILVTYIAGYYFMPQYLWVSNINDIIYSALQVENWQLIRNDTNYLASDNPPSPLQQFWALSLQMQFYIALPLLLFIAVKISKFIGSYKPVLLLTCLIIITSLLFSIYYTAANPSAAYFNTGARAWEFFVGVAIFIVAPFISLSSRSANALMWVGFLLILSVGVFVPGTLAYPGYIAILPVTAAGIMILAGASSNSGLIYKLLSSKAFVYIGGISFSLYLWHWPMLIYFQYYSGTLPNETTVTEGLMIITLAFIFSIISKEIIETPFSKIKKTSVFAPYVIGALFFTPLIILGYFTRIELYKEFEIAKVTEYASESYYTEGSVYIQKGPANIDIRRLITVTSDHTAASFHPCGKGLVDGKVAFCEFGNMQSEDYILLVGGSRLAHWEPLFSYLGKKHGFKVITTAVNNCSFGYSPTMEDNKNCQEWNRQIINYISNLQPVPKAVVVNSSRSETPATIKKYNLEDIGEYTPQGYIKNIKKLLAFNIPVIGIRITPIFNGPNTCLWRNNDAEKCTASQLASLKAENPIIKIKQENNLNGFYPVDFTDVLCDEGECPAAFDGFVTMRDNTHFTQSYIQYLAQALESSLDNQVGGVARLLDDTED